MWRKGHHNGFIHTQIHTQSEIIQMIHFIMTLVSVIPTLGRDLEV